MKVEVWHYVNDECMTTMDVEAAAVPRRDEHLILKAAHLSEDECRWNVYAVEWVRMPLGEVVARVYVVANPTQEAATSRR